MVRAMWKASVRIGERTLPVKLFAAVSDRDVHFRLLHRKDRVPVRQRMIEPDTGREVAREEVLLGVEVEKGVFVVLRRDEVASVRPAPSRTIAVTRFVPREAIDPARYERPYFLGPDGSEAAYFALAAALAESGRCGIASWTMRGTSYFGSLEPRGPHLALVALHAADEIAQASDLVHPGGPATSSAERKLAEQLVATLDQRFEPELLRDEYRARVGAFVAAKAEGKSFEIEEARAPRASADLRDALRRSLAAAKERRGAAA